MKDDTRAELITKLNMLKSGILKTAKITKDKQPGEYRHLPMVEILA